jgi:hypothetical protein
MLQLSYYLMPFLRQKAVPGRLQPPPLGAAYLVTHCQPLALLLPLHHVPLCFLHAVALLPGPSLLHSSPQLVLLLLALIVSLVVYWVFNNQPGEGHVGFSELVALSDDVQRHPLLAWREGTMKWRVPKNPSWLHYWFQSGWNNNLYKQFIVIIAVALVMHILACCVFFNSGVIGWDAHDFSFHSRQLHRGLVLGVTHLLPMSIVSNPVPYIVCRFID